MLHLCLFFYLMPTIETLPYADTQHFSRLFLDYIARNPAVQAFCRYPFSTKGIADSLADLSEQPTAYDRALLRDVLHRQYRHTAMPQAVADNIRALAQPQTMVVATAHQPNICLGPLYLVYKIAAAIRLAAQLQALFPQYRLVPVYYMGSEDHDIAEINHIHVYGKTITWQPTQGGAVGRLPTDNLSHFFDELGDVLGKGDAEQRVLDLLRRCYLDKPTLGEATRAWVNHLFGSYGLVVLDPDDTDLKRGVFSRIAQAELQGIRTTNTTAPPCRSIDYVRLTDQALYMAGYESQAHARPVNLFYLAAGSRERIETHNDEWATADGKQHWTKAQLLDIARHETEFLSPNVILRPAYQQAILPAAAWIGGGGELAYWLQLKGVFSAFGIHYPVLVPRNSALWIDGNTAQKMERLSLSVRDIFRNVDKLVVEYVQRNSHNELNLFAQKQLLQEAFEQILERAQQIDPTLQSSVVGEMTKLTKSVEVLEAKLLRAEKRNFETAVAQIRAIKGKLFPNGTLQERHDNMLPYYIKHEQQFIATLINNFEPLDAQFSIFWA